MESYQHQLPDKDEVIQARRRISPFIHVTPVMTSMTFNQLFGADLYFKCENFQKAGAFKYRGATNAVMSLPATGRMVNVATHSSGNHAQALSLAARCHGISAYVVMPENSPRVKVQAVKGYGGIVRFCEPTLQARESTLAEVIAATGAAEVHPYNDYRIIAGQSTAAAELLDAVSTPDILVAPVGGGGLLSGTILTARYFSPQTKVFGAEPLMANDAWQSLRAGKLIPSVNPSTIADGLRTSLGSLTYPIVIKGVEDILTVSEEGIREAMRLIWERMKIVVEPSGAVPLAAVMEHPAVFRGKKTGLILSGGNVDLNNLFPS